MTERRLPDGGISASLSTLSGFWPWHSVPPSMINSRRDNRALCGAIIMDGGKSHEGHLPFPVIRGGESYFISRLQRAQMLWLVALIQPCSTRSPILQSSNHSLDEWFQDPTGYST
jgi:hypothetical protein